MDRHRSNKAFNPNRFRSLLTSPSPSSPNATSSFELYESDLFASSPDRSDDAPPPPSPPVTSRTPNSHTNPVSFSRRSAFPRPPEGILAALPSSSSSAAASLSSSPSSSSSSPSSARMIPPIPKPRREFPQAPQYQSAPVNVPVVPSRFKNRKGSILLEEEEEQQEEEEQKSDEEEMLPPHEIVARARAKESPLTTFSVLEGAGRTLKGRDLRQVRNAIWRKTGFID